MCTKETRSKKITLTLYHGSDKTKTIEDIKFPGPRFNCDFGPGFYLAERKETAEEWVRGSDEPVVNIYTLTFDTKESIELKGRDWIKVIVGFRESAYKVKFTKNIIIGDIANDKMFSVMPLFMQGIIGDRRLIKCLDYCKLGKQYLFREHAAGLTFIESYIMNDSQRKDAIERYNDRRKRMNRDLIILQREPMQGEKFIEHYLEGGVGGAAF